MNKTVLYKRVKNKELTAFPKAVFLLSAFSIFSLNVIFPKTVLAQNAPTYSVVFGAQDETARGLFLDQLSYPAGHKIKFKIVVYDNYSSSLASGTRVKVDLPDGSFINGPATLTVFSTNGGLASKTVALNTTNLGGAFLTYITGSTKVTWNVDGEGWKEYDNTVWSDGITSDSGVVLGDMPPCRISNCRAEVTFLVDSSLGNSPAQAVPTPVVTNTATTAQSTSQGTVNLATSAATTSAQTSLPKTGPEMILFFTAGLAATAFFGFKLRLVGDLAIKKFALPYAFKSYQGKNLTETDFINNRKLIKSSLKK